MFKGRPALESGRRSRKIDVRFTEEEFAAILKLELALGIRRTEIIRMRVLKDSGLLVVNAREMIQRLDQIGAELGKAGSNINQLARYANTLNKRGMLSSQVLERFNLLFEQYLVNQKSLDLVLRKIIREMNR